MTLVLAAITPKTIWLLTDRRLTFGRRIVSDSAVKTMVLDATDGRALLGYAGLGRTAAGTEPSKWMSNVLGTEKMTIESALGKISSAMQKEMPRHIVQLPHHAVLAPAFVNKEHRVYSIELARFGQPPELHHRYTRFVAQPAPGVQRTRPFAAAGSGGDYLQSEPKSWWRHLLRILKANDRKVVTHQFVADHLARVNLRVHRSLKDNSVGHRCIVAWRIRDGGGGHAYYTGATRDNSSPMLPMVTANAGFSVAAVLKVMMPEVLKSFEAWVPGEKSPVIDEHEINRLLQEAEEQIYAKPNDKLK